MKPTTDISNLYDSVRMIIQALDLHSRSLQKQMGVTMTQLSILLALENESPLPVVEISKRVHLSPATTSGTINRLEDNGFIERIRNGKDRRNVFVHLTVKGKGVLENGGCVLPIEFIRKFENSMPDSEKNMILSAVKMLALLMNGKEHC